MQTARLDGICCENVCFQRLGGIPSVCPPLHLWHLLQHVPHTLFRLQEQGLEHQRLHLEGQLGRLRVPKSNEVIL